MYELPPGSTAQSIFFMLRDSLTAQGKTGLTASSPGARAAFTRNRSAATPFALVAIAPTDAWTSGGFCAVDNSAQPGTYRLDPPDNAFAAGVPHVVIGLGFDSTIDEGALVTLRVGDSNIGPGAIAFPVTITRADTTPIAGAQVWITTDEAGSNTIAGALSTDAFGTVTFYLNAGTYYCWVQDPGYTASNPTTITVS